MTKLPFVATELPSRRSSSLLNYSSSLRRITAPPHPLTPATSRHPRSGLLQANLILPDFGFDPTQKSQTCPLCPNPERAPSSAPADCSSKTGSAEQRAADVLSSLEKIKRQLASASGQNLLQGPLLKRSETLRLWNERWMILDPTTGRMEYNGLPKYEGCCFYIGTSSKKDYSLCVETPGAAGAWVATLQATQLVLQAHKDA